MEEMYEYEGYEETYEQEPPKRKKKTWIWIVAAVLLVALLAVGAILILPRLSGGGSSDSEWTLRYAYIASDNSAGYIILPGGESIKVKKDGILDARITEDLKHIVVLLDDGTLYVTDKDQKTKVTIAEDADAFSLGNNNMIYHDKDDRFHKASLDGKTVVDLPKDLHHYYIISGKKYVSMVFEGKNDSLYALPDDAEEWVKIGSDAYDIRSVSGDGKTVVWTASKSGDNVQYLSEGEEKFSLGEFNGGIYSTFSKDQKLVIVRGTSGDDLRLWIKIRGKDIQSVKLSGAGRSYTITSDAGPIGEVNASQIKYIYVILTSSSKSSLYRVSLNGEKEKLFSKDANIRFMGGNMAYVDDDDTLFVAKMGKKEMGEATKLAGDVKSFGLYGKGKYLYYLRDDVLYGYKFGAKEPVKIASDVEKIEVSENGQYVVIMKDGNDSIGYTLSLWKFGDKSPAKIASDGTVIKVEDSGKVYYRRVDGNYFDLMYYNGKESKKIAVDLMFN